MNQDLAISLGSEMLMMAFQVAILVLGVALITGLVVSLIQVVTQIQEMTLTFVPKILAVGAVLLTFGSWMLQSLVEYARQLILSIPNLF